MTGSNGTTYVQLTLGRIIERSYVYNIRLKFDSEI